MNNEILHAARRAMNIIAVHANKTILHRDRVNAVMLVVLAAMRRRCANCTLDECYDCDYAPVVWRRIRDAWYDEATR